MTMGSYEKAGSLINEIRSLREKIALVNRSERIMLFATDGKGYKCDPVELGFDEWRNVVGEFKARMVMIMGVELKKKNDELEAL